MTDDRAEPQSLPVRSNHPGKGNGAPAGGVKRLRFQGVVNRIARALLRVPVVSHVVGERLITLYVVGRKSGRQYCVPMAYVWHEGALLLGSGFAWGKNLRTGEPLDVRFKGKRRPADVRVLTDEVAVTAHYAVIASRNPGFAKLNRIGFDADGNPCATDLHLAWVAGARVFLLTLR
jgi:deazaflavin-dependent oxidoreductase (nitroreductase family)